MPHVFRWLNGKDMLAGLLSPIVLLVGLFLLRRSPCLGYSAIAFGAALPLPWFFRTESRGFENSWVALNASDELGAWGWGYMRYPQLRIISVALLLTTLAWAAIRLLPSHWQILGRPVNLRTWPAATVSLTFIAYWFATYAFPYRQPVIVDALRAELAILRVEKDGTMFHETRLSVYRDGRYYLVRTDRRLFRYSFVEAVYVGILTDELRGEVRAILALPELRRTLDSAPKSLRAQHGEGWYTEADSYKIAAFTSENSISPPGELRTFLGEIERAVPVGQGSRYTVRDVCLGFCYDPKAGLGYTAENERCAQRPDGKEFCY
jgi:hypothetical protein